MKTKYPQLKRKVPKGELYDKLHELYKTVMVEFDGCAYQRPKHYLILDDIGSEKQVSGN